MSLLEPKEVQIKTSSGEDRTYIYYKFPATVGREIIAKYPTSAMPKLGDYEVNAQTGRLILSYVGVPLPNGTVLPLTTRALIDNHVPDAATLIKIEFGMMEYNFDFFAKGATLISSNGSASNTIPSIIKTVTDLLAQLSAKAKPPSTN